MPIRATESVVQLFDSDVAKAVAHARQVGCHVVTMSLGGKGFFGLKGEIQRAVEVGMIVMAAAGNYVGIVTAARQLRQLSSRGRNRTWRHPLGRLLPRDSGRRQHARLCVYVAAYNGQTPMVRMANGTSYAVAHLAAAAALWLAHHGRQSLINNYGAKRTQAAFLATLRWPGVCVRAASVGSRLRRRSR